MAEIQFATAEIRRGKKQN